MEITNPLGANEIKRVMKVEYKGKIYDVIDKLTDYKGRVSFMCEDENRHYGGTEFIVGEKECKIIHEAGIDFERLTKDLQQQTEGLKKANEILKDKVKELSKNSGAIKRTDVGHYTVDFSKAEKADVNTDGVNMIEVDWSIFDIKVNHNFNVSFVGSNDGLFKVSDIKKPNVIPSINLTKEEVFQMIEALLQLKTID